MPVDSFHADYMIAAPLWQKCRDVVAGQEAVHESGTAYLPKLSGQSESEYEAYKSRAAFFNATARTIDAMGGMLLRKAPLVDLPGSMSFLREDMTMGGVSIMQLAAQLVNEILVTGRAGMLVDYSAGPDEIRNQAEQYLYKARPYVRLYRAEEIINWQMNEEGTVLRRVILREEQFEEDAEDNFVENLVTRYRVLELDEEGYYRQRLYLLTEKNEWQIEFETYPLMNGDFGTEIPFVFVSPRDTSPAVQKPPLLDLVNLNLSHYRSLADYEHGAHYTGLPTAIVTGHHLSDGTELRIGAGEAWVIGEADAKAYYLEFSGKGLETLAQILDRKEKQMAILGARLLREEKRVGESTETAMLNRQGEDAILSAMSFAISEALTRVLRYALRWLGAEESGRVELTRDFWPIAIDSQELRELVSAWQQGAITFDDLTRNLMKGEIVEG